MTCCVVLNHRFDVKFSLPWSLLHVICNLPSISVCMCYDEAVCFCLLVFLNCKNANPSHPKIVASLLGVFFLKAFWTHVSLLTQSVFTPSMGEQ